MENIENYYKTLCSIETLRCNNYGFLKIIFQRILNTINYSWIENEFSKAVTNEDRIHAILSDNTIKNVIISSLEKITSLYRKKRLLISRKQRSHAIEEFFIGAFDKSLTHINQAIIHAPVLNVDKSAEDALNFFLALTCRAILLISRKNHAFAKSDIEIAGECSDLHTTSFRLKELKLHCYLLQRLHSKFSNFKRNEYILTDNKGAFENAVLQNVSNVVTISKTDLYGHQAVASRLIRPGEILVIEKAASSCLLPIHYGSHCHNCFNRFITPIGCSICSNVAYCGIKCRNFAYATFHKYECKIIAVITGSGMSGLSMVALRMVTRFDLDKCLKLYRNINIGPSGTKHMPQNNSSSRKKLHNVTIEMLQVYKLVTHNYNRETMDHFERTLMALFLSYSLKVANFFERSSYKGVTGIDENQQFVIIGSLILRNLQVLQFNAHEIFEIRVKKNGFRNCKIIYIGIGIYPTAARFNHSCYSAVSRYFSGDKLIIKSIRAVPAGDVIAENYGPTFTKMKRYLRQRMLSGRYWFECSCQPCLENWPTLDILSDNYVRLRCWAKQCTAIIAINEYDLNYVMCKHCGMKINIAKMLWNISRCKIMYSCGISAMDQGYPKDAIALLTTALARFYELAIPPHRRTHLAEIALSLCITSFGNIFNII